MEPRTCMRLSLASPASREEATDGVSSARLLATLALHMVGI